MPFKFVNDLPVMPETNPGEDLGAGVDADLCEALDQMHEIEISSKEIIQLAYSHMELLLRYPNGTKFRDEQARAYTALFRLVAELLQRVDSALLDQHRRVNDFYRLELMRDDDRLFFSEDPLRKFA